MKRDYTDAEFEVVSEAPKPASRPAWNGLGLPPWWASWGAVEKVTYVIVYGALLAGVFLFHRWLYHAL